MQGYSAAISVTSLAAVLLVVVVLSAIDRPDKREAVEGTRQVGLRIDPNQAEADTLSLLPMIGPGLAQRIVDDRRANGLFHSAQDMTRVSRVGVKTVEAIKPWVAFESHESAAP